MLGECILENEEKKLELIPLKHVLMTIDTTLISLIPLYQKYTNDFRESSLSRYFREENTA